MVEKEIELERIRERIRIIKVIGIVVLILIVIGIPAFTYFRITSNAHIALREAKNVKLTIQMLDIEYYGQGSSIYDASRASGLKKSAENEIWQMLEHDGEVVLQSYDYESHTIYAFTYTNDHYQVVYNMDKENGDTWQVRYFVLVID
jgi:hypothetical protein